MDCPQNVKGSGAGKGRACRFSQRLAIAFPQKMDEVYQLQLPATSIFSDTESGKMPMQAYAKFLQANNTPAIAIVTEMYFDENSEVPKLFFKPVRPLTEEELEKAVEMREHQDTKRAVTMTVAQTDGVQKLEVKEAPKPARKPRANAIAVEEPEPEVEVEAAEEVVSEPKKVRKRQSQPRLMMPTLLTSWTRSGTSKSPPNAATRLIPKRVLQRPCRGVSND